MGSGMLEPENQRTSGHQTLGTTSFTTQCHIPEDLNASNYWQIFTETWYKNHAITSSLPVQGLITYHYINTLITSTGYV